MADVIRIEWDKVTEEQATNTPIKEEIKADEATKTPEVKKPKSTSNDALVSMAQIGAVYGVGRQTAQMEVNYIAQNYTIRGDTLKAERLNTTFQNVTNNVGLGLAVGGSIATLNPIAIGMTAYAIAQRAFNVAINVRKYQAQVTVERYRSEYYSNRLVKNISEVR